MLIYRDQEQFAAEPAVRKLLQCILLMALRDGSRDIVFRLSDDGIRIHYYIEPDWYELIPPPRHVWPELMAEVRRHSRLIRPPVRLTDRLREWFRGRPPVPEVGWLVYQFGASRYEIAVTLNPVPPDEELRLRILTTPTNDQAAAANILGIDTLIEFDDLAEATPPSTNNPT